MKTIGKKMIAGAIAASFVLGGSYAALSHSQAYAADASTTTSSSAAATQHQGKGPGHMGRGGFGFGGGNLVKEAATVLGQQESDLQASLQSGKTLLDVATAAGLTEDDFLAKLAAAEKTAIDAQVTAGKLTQDQADKIVSGLSDRLKQQIEHTGPMGGPGRGGRGGPGGFGGSSLVKEAATVLGQQESDLQASLQSGKTLLDVATAAGLTEDDFLAKLTAAEKTAIDAQVTAGKLTQDQADKIVSGLSDRLKQQIEHTGPMGGPGRDGHGGPGGLGFGGPMGNSDLLPGILGMTQDELRTQLDSGTSIADLAAAKGISEDDLISKIKDGMTDSIKNFVEAKHVKPANAPAANPSSGTSAATTNS